VSITGSDLPNKSLCLTFDDGPGSQTLMLAQYLYDQDIPATFFVSGYRVDKWQADGKGDLLLTLLRLGHRIGNHTYDHPDLRATPFQGSPIMALDSPYATEPHASPADCVKAENQLIAPYVRKDLFFLRAPFGEWNDDLTDLFNADPDLTKLNYKGPIGWNIGAAMPPYDPYYSSDWYCWSVGKSSIDCASGLLTDIQQKQKGIVLMHDNDNNLDSAYKTYQLVCFVVPLLKEMGYRFFPLQWIPQVAGLIRNSGDCNAMPADWFNLVRGEHVDWHQIIINSSGSMYSFDRAGDTGKIYWNGNEIGALAKEIAGRADANDLIFVFFMGVEKEANKVWYQSIEPGSSPSAVFKEFAPGKSTSGLSRLHVVPETRTLRFEFWDSDDPPNLWSRTQIAPGIDSWTPIRQENTICW
jgi:peptidoglycan/xylan/chitin deacetylase (PgdA/CDA1 family)